MLDSIVSGSDLQIDLCLCAPVANDMADFPFPSISSIYLMPKDDIMPKVLHHSNPSRGADCVGAIWPAGSFSCEQVMSTRFLGYLLGRRTTNRSSYRN